MNVGIFVVDGVGELGLGTLLGVFSTANVLRDELPHPPAAWNVHTVSLGESVRSGSGNLVPTTPLGEISEPFDTVAVAAVNVLEPGSLVELVSAPGNAWLVEHIRSARARGAHLAAACTGTFFLAEAGVLAGGPATTSWWLGASFRKRYPEVDLDETSIVCHGDGVTTAGASLSHVDMALSLVYRTSPELAEQVRRYLAVDDRTSQASYVIPEVVARGNSLVAGYERWVRDHLSEQFLISTAARELGVTERSLQRATRAALGMSPKDFADDIRLDRAGRLLRTTDLTVEAIAREVGYANASSLRALARRRRGLSLTEIRARRPAR
ncbi:GlxA family transcriptional regulator [Nocardia paucivorans]|uniref:GlxA family transcriptional regulator n=1 Tax=Nocardia paucivorans TaxID=114259 RepID=UPI0005945177|nr:helix-turn-helix domain-containing protein [Nocardia paucivorans]